MLQTSRFFQAKVYLSGMTCTLHGLGYEGSSQLAHMRTFAASSSKKLGKAERPAHSGPCITALSVNGSAVSRLADLLLEDLGFRNPRFRGFRV